MDNLTHSLAGWALGQAGLKTKSRKGLAALILGANAPDIDVFFGRVPWEPLAMHRGFTHSLIGGVVILPLLLTGLLLLLDRWQVSRGASFKSGLPMRPGWLLALAYIGTLTHPLLDLQTTYAVQLFSPVRGSWWHMDSLFIIDIWLLSGIGLAIAWSKMREKQGREWRRPMQAAVAGALVYILGNAVLTQHARTQLLRFTRDTGGAEAIYASPPPLTFWRRDLVWRRADGWLGFARYDPFGSWHWGRGLAPGQVAIPDRMRDPVVRRAMASAPQYGSFFRWSTMPFAFVVEGRCTTAVIFRDARYIGGAPRNPFVRRVDVPTCAEPRPR